MSLSVYQETIQKLTAAKIPSPRLEARLLIAAAAQLTPDLINTGTTLTPEQNSELNTMLQRRLEHKPLDKILNRKEFYKYSFLVDENVLTPRPDTEILVEAADNIIKTNKIDTILDLGTGSGCILLSLLKENPQIFGTGVEKSPKAITIAEQNCLLLGLEKNCRFILADWFDTKFLNLLPQTFDLITSNPPYIPTQHIANLEPEVKNYDPSIALDGGADGLDSYRQIAAHCSRLLNVDGYLLLEIGIGQADDVIQIFEQQELSHISTLKDLSGIQRCIIFRKKDCK